MAKIAVVRTVSIGSVLDMFLWNGPHNTARGVDCIWN